jgi:hypothetical protein
MSTMTATSSTHPVARRVMGRPRISVAVLLTALLLLFAAVPSARADESPLEYSTDGITWTSTPQAALFDTDLVMVPGGSTSVTLHLRSNAPSTGVLDLALTNVRVSGQEAAEAFGVSATTDGGTGVDAAGVVLPRTAFGELGERTRVGPPLELEPGQSARLTLTIDLAADPGGTGAQNSSIGLDLSIVLQDASAVGGAGPGTGQEGPGELVIPAFPSADGDRDGQSSPTGTAPTAGQTATAGTDGSDADGRGLLAVTGIARSMIIVALVMTLCGGLLLLIGRRRREAQE